MKKKYNTLELATGFLMGSIPAFFLEMALVSTYNLICDWKGCGSFSAEWWMLIPFPLIIGGIVSVTIANLHLEDY